AVVAPASMVIVVVFTDCVASDGVKLKLYCCFVAPVLLTRMSLCQCEPMPSRWPTEGMISAFVGGAEFAPGVTGVTRLMETGVDMTVVTSFRALLVAPIGVSDTMTVLVNVPFGRFDGSVVSVSVIPSGVSTPLDGATLIHGSSVFAEKL